MADSTRRMYLRSVSLVTAAGLAGCFGRGKGGGNGDGDGTGGDNPDAEDHHQIIYKWLMETEVGGADDSYGGKLYDWRDRDAMTISVGASGNGGNFAYAPSAVVISTGTDVEWPWTGDGGAHNVAARPGEQLGTSISRSDRATPRRAAASGTVGR